MMRIRTKFKDKPPRPKCACGCGEYINWNGKNWRTYRPGHCQRGCKASAETRLKMSKKRRGRKLSEAHCKAISESKKGKRTITPEQSNAISISNKTREVKQSTRKKMSLAHIGKIKTEGHLANISKALTGKYIGAQNNNWRGGLSRLPYGFGFTKHLKKKIMLRDEKTCQLCFDKHPLRFAVHHIDYNKNNHNLENLITLCASCHTKTNFHRKYYRQIFKECRI